MSKEKLLINNPKSNNSEAMSNKQIEEMAKDVWKASCAGRDIPCHMCKFADMKKDSYSCLDYVIAEGLYTAGYHKQSDVVPKSEVAKEFICFVGDPHKVDHCPYIDEIEKAKAEVAREIFEEIDILVYDYKHCYIQSIQFIAELAELKKKYTEVQHDG